MLKTPPKTIGITLKPGSKEAVYACMELLRWVLKNLKSFNVTNALIYDFNFENSGLVLPFGNKCDEVQIKRSDIIIVFGGDGTLLSTVRLIDGMSVPILGVNSGSLGFLTETPLDSYMGMLSRVLLGEFDVEYKSMVDCIKKVKGEEDMLGCALNDIVVARGPYSKLITLDVCENGTFINKYRADGIIVATPTGSTAYTLASGGPIVYPYVNALIVTPICPHTLSNRALVVPDSMVLELRLTKDEEAYGDVYVALDGQEHTKITGQESILVSKSKKQVCLIKNPDINYFNIVRTKLKWG